MAEQSTRIADQATGDYIATRDANDQAGGQDRVIQLVDLAMSRKISGFDPTSPLRTVSIDLGSGDVGDVNDLVSIPSAITSNLLTMGDQQQMGVTVRFIFQKPSAVANQTHVVITPLALEFVNPGYEIISILEPQVFQGFTPLSETGGVGCIRDFNQTITPMKYWYAGPFSHIGFHVKAPAGSSPTGTSLTVYVYAWALSGLSDVGPNQKQIYTTGFPDAGSWEAFEWYP